MENYAFDVTQHFFFRTSIMKIVSLKKNKVHGNIKVKTRIKASSMELEK